MKVSFAIVMLIIQVCSCYFLVDVFLFCKHSDSK
jgi:hypothetical protein